MIAPKTKKEEGTNRAQLIKHEISDLERIDQRVKHGIRAIKERLRAAKDAECNVCPILEKEVQRQGQQSKEKDKQIMQLNLKIDRISQHVPYAGPHSARKADLQTKRETLSRNANALLSDRKPAIQEIYRIQERLPQEMETLRAIEERTILLRSREKRQREVIKRLSSINKLNQRSELSPNLPTDSRQEQDSSMIRKDDTLRSFKERVAVVDASLGDEFASEFEGASFTTINDKCNTLNNLISELKSNNETLNNRNAYLQKQSNKLKEQINQKDSQIITLNQEKLVQEKHMMGKLMSLTDAFQDLERQHQGCKRSLQYYQNKSATLEEALLRDRQKYEQQISSQTEQLMVALAKAGQLERVRNERDEFKGQIKEEVIRRLALIEQINMLNKQNYTLKLTGGSLSQQIQQLSSQNQQLRLLINQKNEQSLNEKTHHASKISESQQVRSSLETLCHQLQQQNQALKQSTSSIRQQIHGQLSETIKFLQEKIKRAHCELQAKENTIDSNEKSISELKWQITKLNRTLDQQGNTIRSLGSSSLASQSEVTMLAQKCDNVSAELQQLRKSSWQQTEIDCKQITTLGEQIQAMKNEASKRDKQFQQLTTYNIRKGEQIEQLIISLEQSKEQHQQVVQAINKQIEELKIQHNLEIDCNSLLINKMKDQHEEAEMQLRAVIQRLQGQLNDLKTENNHIKGQCSIQLSQITALKQLSQSKSVNQGVILQQLQCKSKSLESHIIGINQKMQQQYDDYEQKVQELTRKIMEADHKINQKGLENEQFAKTISNLQAANTELKSRHEAAVQQRQVAVEKARSFEQNMEHISQSHEYQLKFFTLTIDNLQAQIEKLRKQLEKTQKNESRHQQKLMQSSRNDIEQLQQLRRQMESAEKDYKSMLADKDNQLRDKSDNQQTLLREIQIMKNRKQEIQVQLLTKLQQAQKEYSQQLLQHHQMAQDKMKQLQDQHNITLNLLAKAHQDKMNQLTFNQQQKIRQAINERDQLSGSYQLQRSEYQRKLAQAAQEIDKVGLKLIQSLQMINILKTQIDQKEAVIAQVKNQAIEQGQTIEGLNQEIQILNSKLNTSQTRTQSLQLQLRQTNNDFMRVSADKQATHMLISQQKQELFAQRLKIDEISKDLIEAKNIIRDRQDQKGELERQQSQLKEQLRWLQSQIDAQDKEIQALQAINQNLSNAVTTLQENKQSLEKQVVQMKEQAKIQTKTLEDRESELKNIKQQYKSHAFQVEYLSAKMGQIAKKLSQSKQQYKDLQDYYAKKNERLAQSMEEMREQIAESIEKINKKQETISQKQSQNKLLRQQLQNQTMHIQLITTKIQEERQSLHSKIITLQDRLNTSQRLLAQGQNRMAKCRKQHSQALQMLQQQIVQREVEIQHKDNRYLIQITSKNQKIQQLQKQLNEAKKMLQQELAQRQNYILLNEKQIERIKSKSSKQVQTLKWDSEQAKRILQVEVVQRQTEIRAKDIQIADLQTKHAQYIQALKKENYEAKSLLQQQIVERQTQISNKDLKISKLQISHAMQINKLIANYEQQKRLLQQQIVERQAAIVEYDLRFNETLISHGKQKERAAQNMVAYIEEIQRKILQRQIQLKQLQSQVAQLHEQNSCLKMRLNNAEESIGNHEAQIQRLIQSREISQSISEQNLQKVRNLEQTLTEKLNIPLGSLEENEATLSLALQSVHLLQHETEIQKEANLDVQDHKMPTVQSPLRNQEQLAISYEQKCRELQGNIQEINQSNEQIIGWLQSKNKESQSIIKSLETQLESLQRQKQQERHQFSLLNSDLNRKLAQLTSELNESKAQAQHSVNKLTGQVNQLRQLKMLEKEQLLRRIESQKADYEKEIERIQCENSQLHATLQENGYKLKDAEQKVQRNSKKYEQSQAELYELEGIFINHKISLQQMKLQNKTLKERLESIENKVQQNRQHDQKIIDENQEFVEEIFEELSKRYQAHTEINKNILDQYEQKLNRIFEKMKELRNSIARKSTRTSNSDKQTVSQVEKQVINKQLLSLKSDNERLQNELTLAQLESGQLILEKEQQVNKLSQQLNEIKGNNHPPKYQRETARQGKLRIKPISSFRIEQHESFQQQTPERDVYTPGSLIDPLKDLVSSPENEPIEFPSQEDIFNVISLYLGDFEEGSHELRHEYKHLLNSKSSLLDFIQKILVQMKKKSEIDMQAALKKPLSKAKSEEFIAPHSLPNVPIQTLLEHSSNNSSNNKVALMDSPIVEIEEEDGEALLTEVKPRTGSEKKMSLLLAKDISQVLSESEKQDEIQEMLGMSLPEQLELSQKSESVNLIGSQLSLKSSRSAKQTDDHYKEKIKNSLMMAKLRKKK